MRTSSMAAPCAEPSSESGTRTQKMTFNPSWLMRPARAPFTTPNVGDVRFVSTLLNCVWFNTLNDSSLNCSCRLSESQSEVFEQREIEIVHVRSAQSVASHAAERSGGRLRECGGVEPLGDGVPAGVRVADEVGSIRPKLSFRPPRSAAVTVIGNPRCHV